MEFSSICRICLKSLGQQRYDIFTSYYVIKNNMNTKYVYSDMLSLCTNLKPLVKDGLPKYICKACSRELKRSYSFYTQCVKSEGTLRDYLEIKPEVERREGLEKYVDCEQRQYNVKVEENVCCENPAEDRTTLSNSVASLDNDKDGADIKLETADENSENDVDDDSYWDAEDNSLLQEIKLTKELKTEIGSCNEEQNQKKILKKRGRKKHVRLDGDGMVPGSKMPHQCDICGKFLSNKSNLKAHKICHTDLRPYKCDQCSATFRGHSALFQHNKIHTGEKSFHCEFCPKQFSRRSGLVNHIRMHTGEKLFNCEICCKSFVQSAQLSIHMKRHKGDKSYLCQDCGKGFPIKSDLKVHQRIHNGEKPYACHLCSKTFATSGNLSIHIRIHNKEIRYNCKECQRGFVTCSAYNVHVKRHKGQRDYHCECGKTFYTSSALKQHKVVHTGEKKYQCKICDRKFTQTSHLSRHFKRDHAKPNAPVPSSDHYKLIISDSFSNVFDSNQVSIDMPKLIDSQTINSGVKCEGS